MTARLSEKKSPGLFFTLVLVIWAVGLAALVYGDGSPVWGILRIICVGLIFALTFWLIKKVSRLGALVMVFLATAGIIAGIVFGLRFLMVEGLTWRSIVGCIELLVSLLLIILAFRYLVSAIHLVWKIISILLLSILVFILALNLTPAVMAANLPLIKHDNQTPADFGLKAEEVHYPSADGTELFAWYVRSANGANLIMRHGSGSTAGSLLPQARVLAAHGYGLLITDARGHGNSRGIGMDFGWYGDPDIQAAIDYLTRQPAIDVKRIGLIGFSMGGEEAVGAAGKDRRVSAVVAEGVTGRTAEDKIWMKEVFGWRGNIQFYLEYMQYGLSDLLSGAACPPSLADSALNAQPCPIFLIAAGKIADERYSAENIKNTASNVSLWVVPESGHIAGLNTAPAEWEQRVTGFLDAALLKP